MATPTQTAAQNTTAKPASAAPATSKSTAPGLAFTRHFTKPGISPYDEITWERRDAVIQDWKGNLIFEQKNVEVPTEWSVTATNIVASKYLHGLIGSCRARSPVSAPSSPVSLNPSATGASATVTLPLPKTRPSSTPSFAHLLLNQKVAFNSPVWFNVGCDRLEPNSDAQNWHWDSAEKRQVIYSVTGYSPSRSAAPASSTPCRTRSTPFLPSPRPRACSSNGAPAQARTCLQHPRFSMETLSGGGTASGPLSFMRGFDAFAGVIKSGGKTRRAAKMVVLNIDHPDIEDFIHLQGERRRKSVASRAGRLRRLRPRLAKPTPASFSRTPTTPSALMTSSCTPSRLTAIFSTKTVKEKNAGQGVQGPRPHAQPSPRPLGSAAIPACSMTPPSIKLAYLEEYCPHQRQSNPCSEYMFLDDSACNLASFNLLKFLTPGGQFDVASYRHAIGIVTTAMEIIVDSAGYPTEMIAKNSHDYRPLGLGYANLGALLMAFGLPYDSDAGRDFAGTLTAILCGDAYWQSARIAETCAPLGAATPLTQRADITGGACPGFYVNREPFLDVIRMHRAEVNNIGKSRTSAEPFVAPQLDGTSSPPPLTPGMARSLTARSSATATRRSPSSPPPAPSAS